MKLAPALYLTTSLLALNLSAAAQPAPDRAAALQAEMSWLRLIDAGDYHAAWLSASKQMQDAVPEPKLADAIRGARTPLGALTTRTLKDAQATTQLPGAPDGHYLLTHYTTQFTNKADGIETVVAAQAPDGSWHVSGYFIR